MSSLPVTIYQYAGSAYQDLVDLSWVAALLITFGVLDPQHHRPPGAAEAHLNGPGA